MTVHMARCAATTSDQDGQGEGTFDLSGGHTEDDPEDAAVANDGNDKDDGEGHRPHGGGECPWLGDWAGG